MKYGINNKERIKELLQKGETKHTKFFKLYYIKNTDDDKRIAFAISKKIGNAVTRNRMKRVTREAFRICFHKPFDFLIKMNSKNVNFLELKSEFEKLNKTIND